MGQLCPEMVQTRPEFLFLPNPLFFPCISFEPILALRYSFWSAKEAELREDQMRICDLIKNQETWQAEMNQTVLATVRSMVEHNIGAVPVMHNGKLVGIFSERDLMKRVVAEGRDPCATCLAEVMTGDPVSIGTNDELENCLTLMRQNGFRHLPVCFEGELVGMVSLRDILLHDLNEKDDEVRMMRAYIHSVPDA
jgi:signal-transduction protein with cAMP-binding, CBS, and nucleotidyltransferase domain